MSLEPFKATFFQECDELLAGLEPNLVALGGSPDSAEPLHAAFRSVHSVKGGATMFGFTRIVALAHAIETALDLARAGRIPVTPDFIDKALAAADCLSDLVEAARAGAEAPAGCEIAATEGLATACGADLAHRLLIKVPGPRISRAAGGTEVGTPLVNRHPQRNYRIRFEPSVDLLRRGLDPIALVRSLKKLGQLRTTAHLDRLPALSDLDPAELHLGWTFELETSIDIDALRREFEFVAASARIEIIESETGLAEPEPEPDASAVLEPVLTVAAATAVQAAQPGPPAYPVTAAHLAVGAQGGPAHDPPPATASTAALSVSADRRSTMSDRRVNSIRVDLPRVERLVDLVGEITIAQAMVLQHLDQAMVHSNPLLFRAFSDLLNLSRTLQDSVMAIRALPIGTIFGRLPRIVRDSASLLGREVVLKTEGEATEIDKTIVEQLADPLMHIVRNAIDHGIEPPEVRHAAGKPLHGTITVSAAQRGSRIVVEIIDDGRGINRQAVLARARALGTVADGLELSAEEIDALIFMPGLTTARTVSEISGRGVGMDVVYRNIEKLGGQVAVRSEPGRGTAISISVPLTLAVLDAMRIRCADQTYLVPLSHIIECLAVPRAELHTIPGACRVVDVRGRQIRLIDLAAKLGLIAPRLSDRAQIVLVEIGSGAIVGLLVDEVCGHHQIVVKSIREHFTQLHGIAGGTILGDGNVALILDVNQLSSEQAAPLRQQPERTQKAEARAA